MPLYSYKCTECGEVIDRIVKLADYNLQQYHTHVIPGELVEAKFPMEKIVTAARVVADYPGYECPITGAWVEGRAAHRENLARHGCRVFESGEMENTKRHQEKLDKELESQVEATVGQFIAELPSAKKDKLAAEMDAGFDVQYTRQTV